MLKRYNDFLGENYSYSNDFELLKEDIGAGQTYMMNLYLNKKKEKMGWKLVDGKLRPPVEGEKVGLSPQEQQTAKNDIDFQKIVTLCTNKLKQKGLIFAFTKFFFEDLSDLDENERFEQLNNLADSLIEMKPQITAQVKD